MHFHSYNIKEKPKSIHMLLGFFMFQEYFSLSPHIILYPPNMDKDYLFTKFIVLGYDINEMMKIFS